MISGDRHARVLSWEVCWGPWTYWDIGLAASKGMFFGYCTTAWMMDIEFKEMKNEGFNKQCTAMAHHYSPAIYTRR